MHDKIVDFQVYISLFIQLLELIVVAFIGCVTIKVNNKANRISGEATDIQKYFKEVKNTPLLSHYLNKGSWILQNSSEGVACNVYIKHFTFDQYSKWIISNPISNKTDLELFWIRSATKILICYTDSKFQKFYITKTENCKSITIEINKELFKSIENLADKTAISYAHLYDKKDSELKKPICNLIYYVYKDKHGYDCIINKPDEDLIHSEIDKNFKSAYNPLTL